jgi:ssDNA-binding Zn-finger/Zn-ribbon topoisomerase 1
MDECVYYTSRDLWNGDVTVWVLRKPCPKCGKALMEKPRGDDGKLKIRAQEYTCPACHYTVQKEEYEDTLTACADYTCPECRAKGESEVPFKRKSIAGVKTLRFICAKCKANIDVTQKMKEPKKKGKPADDSDTLADEDS